MSAAGSKRVLGLVTSSHGGMGGIARYNRDFYEALATVPGIGGIDVLPRGGTTKPDALPHRLRLHPACAGRAHYAAVALRLAVQVRPDVVICGHLYMVPFAAWAARLCGAALVVQLHGIEIWHALSVGRRRAIERAALVLCVSRDTRARLLRVADLPPERVVVLPNTVSDAFSPGERQPPADGARLLLSVGRLDAREAYKGYGAVIACLPELRERGYDVTYCIAGEGDDRPRLEQLARDRGVADRVRFAGAVPGRELPALYRSADLFVLPSRGEGFGIVFLEAMACGTPALGLAVGGAVDALEGLGRAVADGEDLAGAIASELDRSARVRRDGEAQGLAARVQARFGREVFARNVALAMARLGMDAALAPAEPAFPHPPSAARVEAAA